MWVCELKLDPLHEQQVLLSVKPSLQFQEGFPHHARTMAWTLMLYERGKGQREGGEQEASHLSSCPFIQREIFLIHCILSSFLISAVE